MHDWLGRFWLGKDCGNYAVIDTDSLIAALADSDEDTRNNAYRMLENSYEACADRLIAELHNPILEIRRAVALILCHHSEPRAADAFIFSLEDEDRLVRVRGVLGLAKIKDERALEPLRQVLWHDSDSVVRSRAAQALGMIGGPDTYDELLSALQDPDPEVHYGAAEGLGRLGDKRALSHLASALKDDDATMRYAAAQALGELGDADAVEPLMEALRVSDDESRGHVVRALMRFNDPRTVEPLILALRTGDPYTRSAAAFALAKLKEPRAVNHLIAILRSDEDGCVRSNAIAALGGIGDPSAVEPILHALSTDKDPGVRWVAASCLARRFKDSRIPDALLSMLDDPHPIVHSVVIGALGNTGDPRAVEPLINILAGPDAERDTELTMHSDEVISIEMCADRSSDRISAAISLGKLGGDSAINALIGALVDEVPEVRSAATRALEKMDDPRAAEALQHFTE
jgi:HEAT repeat protein